MAPTKHDAPLAQGTLIMVTPAAMGHEANTGYSRHGNLYRIKSKLTDKEDEHRLYACESLCTGEIVYWFEMEFIVI